MSDDYSMYDTDDLNVTDTSTPTIKKGNFVNEIEIEGRKFLVVDPSYIEFVNAQFNELKKRCAFLENELRITKQLTRQKDSNFQKTLNQLASRSNFD